MGRSAASRRDRLDHLRQPLLRREPAERADDERRRAAGHGARGPRRPTARPWPRADRRRPSGWRCTVDAVVARRAAPPAPRCGPRRAAAASSTQADERPVAEERAAETLGDRAGARSAGASGWLAANSCQVVVAPRRPAAEQGQRAGLVHLRVVQDDQPRVVEQVAPHVVVAGGVAELVDDQVVGGAPMPPDEVGGAGSAVGGVRTVEPLDVDVDRETASAQPRGRFQPSRRRCPTTTAASG